MRLVFTIFAVGLLLAYPARAGEKEDDAYTVGTHAPHMLWAAARCGGSLTKMGKILIAGAKQFYPAQFDKGFEEGKPTLASLVKRLGKNEACELYRMYFGPNGMVFKGVLSGAE